MKRRTLIKGGLTAMSSLYLSKLFGRNINTSWALNQPVHFKPSWGSLAQYQVPDWFRDAKFGIWAHWGPQCEPEYGDWYARGMYEEGSEQYKYHCKKYGHPSKFGFKDVINEWKADQWDPNELVSLYKKAGAKYFVALANHHDNFDLYPNPYQRWNSTQIGPKKDLIKGWAESARANQIPFGVSIHASHAWSWYEAAQQADQTGPLRGVPYDGNVTASDGKGKWWDGFNPQDLYCQHHPLSAKGKDNNKQWAWADGAYPPSKQYCERFYKRIKTLMDNYEPDLMYFDDTVLPLWPVSNVGLQIAADLYNSSIRKHGNLKAVVNGKILDEQQRKCMVWDIERGQSNEIEPLPWQTDTCIGNWHYDRRVYDDNKYKTAKTVIQTLADVVSKNGNLLLNIPVRGNGSIDEKERAIVEDIATWMQVNGEAIYCTRPWVKFGEGPASENAAPLAAQGFNEGKGKAFSAADIRFTAKQNLLYAMLMGRPENNVFIKSLANKKDISAVSLLGYESKIDFKTSQDGLAITFPERFPDQPVYVLKITGAIS
jgi:alpha-L-fucosidase